MTSDRTRFGLLLACFFLSGFAALLYQTAWTREFSFVFGTSELAIAAVLSAYMAGLALGAAVAGRLAARIERPVLAYGVLELLIALFALAVPFGIRSVRAVYLSALGGLDAPPETLGLTTALFHLAGTFVVLVPCTALMGATLPLLARHAVHHDEQIGPRVGTLYAINTAGAIVGTLCAAFFLLPELGLRKTVYLGAVSNVGVFLAAALLARAGAAPAASGEGAPARFHWILPFMTISGAVSFAYEVLWTRMLGQVLGGSTHAFATMLASFLLGIALGSAVAARFARTRAEAALGFVLAQLGTAVFAWLAFVFADQLPVLAGTIGATARTPAPGIFLAGAFLLPFTLCIGATFPFAVRLFARRAEDAAQVSARVYAWNTVGSIAGATLAGFLFLPWLGLEGTMALGVGLNFALAAGVAMLATPRRAPLAGLAVAGLVAAIVVPHSPPWGLLHNSVLAGKPFLGEIVYLGVGRSATVTLMKNGSTYRVATNGLPESAIELPEVPPTRFSEVHWLSMVPVMARPDTKDMLIIGLGGGNTLSAVPSSVARVDVIELEPEVVTANRRVPARRGGEPLDEARVTLKLGDARGALTLASKRYDAIVSQPSHPWTSGASHLYTREFFELVRGHLVEGGVFTQWIGVGFLDEFLLRTLLATLLDVFPHLEVYRPVPNALLFVGSEQPVGVLDHVEAAIAAAPESFAREGLYRAEDAAPAMVLDTKGARDLARGAPINTDDHNRLATVAFGGNRRFDWINPILRNRDPLASRMSQLEIAPLVRRLNVSGQPARARDLVTKTRGADHATGAGFTMLSGRTAEAAAKNFRRALELDPGHADARAGLMITERWGSEPITGLTRRERAMVDGWRLAEAGDAAAIRELEPDLAAWKPGDLLYVDALRLRIAWRVESGSAQHGAEALAFNTRVLQVSGNADDFLARAGAAQAAREPDLAWGALETLAPVLAGPKAPARAKRAVEIARRLPPHERGESITAALQARLK
ncbi:MAG: fused MFS/spermidine synthase [Deltaproteobacteria bacterium]|nr:fused MFS/spermidine synthase [Deltaproteobacteria bacterium]MBW2446526.1 fused MFS/spermidine synthase [Deltaproteobacteria bacterium]